MSQVSGDPCSYVTDDLCTIWLYMVGKWEICIPSTPPHPSTPRPQDQTQLVYYRNVYYTLLSHISEKGLTIRQIYCI